MDHPDPKELVAIVQQLRRGIPSLEEQERLRRMAKNPPTPPSPEQIEQLEELAKNPPTPPSPEQIEQAEELAKNPPTPPSLDEIETLRNLALRYSQIVEQLEDLQHPYDLLRRQSAQAWAAAEPALQLLVDDWLENKRRPRRIQTVLDLAERCWFVDIELSVDTFDDMRTWLDAGDEQRLEEFLVRHFRGCIDDVERLAVQNHPDREKVLRQAFQAHRDEQYFLSTAVFLAQADGIHLEKVEFRSKKKGQEVVEPAKLFGARSDTKPQGREEAEQRLAHVLLESSMTEALLVPVMERTPILANEKELKANPARLNRHQVLHGVSKVYGTEENSLRALSILKWTVHHVDGMS